MSKSSVNPDDFMGAKMPTRRLEATSQPRTIDSLLHDFESFNETKALVEYPWAERFVMGLPLPTWQRDFKWSDEQCQRFITSVWTGCHLGNYVVNREESETAPDGKLVFTPMSNVVIDGQQRLMAIQKYILNEIAVPDLEGVPRFFSEVGAAEKRRFGNTIFTRSEIDIASEENLRMFYDMLNYGGVPHLPEERAVKIPRP